MPIRRDYSGRVVVPQRPYRNLGHFRSKVIWTSGAQTYFQENPSKFPCFDCAGSGTIYDPNDPPCPVEGNKMRNRIKCPRCGGTRCIAKEEFAKAYHEAIDKYLKDKAEYKALSKAKSSGLKKLTKEEREAIRQLGI